MKRSFRLHLSDKAHVNIFLFRAPGTIDNPFLVREITMQTLNILVWSSASCVLYLLTSRFVSSYRTAAKSRKLSCEEPAVQKNRYPLGIDNLLRILAAERELYFPRDLIQRIVDAGATTYKFSILGNTTIFTADEKNIQAVLATKFADFGANPIFILLFRY